MKDEPPMKQLADIRFRRACKLLERALLLLENPPISSPDPDEDDPRTAILILKISAFLREERPR